MSVRFYGTAVPILSLHDIVKYVGPQTPKNLDEPLYSWGVSLENAVTPQVEQPPDFEAPKSRLLRFFARRFMGPSYFTLRLSICCRGAVPRKIFTCTLLSDDLRTQLEDSATSREALEVRGVDFLV